MATETPVSRPGGRNGVAFAHALLFLWFAVLITARSQALDVSLAVSVTRDAGQVRARHNNSGNVVVWLTPALSSGRLGRLPVSQVYALTQKDKQFTPHVLVVPTGSSVNFPNLDPFFHNVFSLFNGKRFDLGLYEAHSQRTVRFDREGVSYIFCNIHPEMAAVIISLDTPYFGASSPDGSVVIRNVPAGRYRLSVWAENVSTDSLSALSRTVDISQENTRLQPLYLKTNGDMTSHHQNKFGENYPPVPKEPY